MPIYVELRDADGRQVRGMPDPFGGTFDAAGDIDRFIDDTYFGYDEQLDIPALRSVDPYGRTEMTANVMPSLLNDIAEVIPRAKEGPELRALLRLRAMAERCDALSGAALVWFGD